MVGVASVEPAVVVSGVSADEVREFIARLAGPGPKRDDEARIELLGALEALKSAAAAAQARVSVDFAASQEAAQHQAGVLPDKVGCGIGAQVALARGESPVRGSRHLGLAKALVGEMPHTLAALASGRVSEWGATLVVQATACLSVVDRGRVDERLAPRFGSLSDRALGGTARSLAYELDPAGFVHRGRAAAADRRVSVRPAPEQMAYLSGLVPMAEGVGAYAGLDKEAKRLKAAGDPRTLHQIRADLFLKRVCGSDTATEGVGVEVQVVITDAALFAGASTPARLVGYGPIPAQSGRDLACHGTTRPLPVPDGPGASFGLTAAIGSITDTEASDAGVHCGDAAGGEEGESAPVQRARAWVRRLFTDPRDDSVAHRDPRRRLFTGALRELVIARDQSCRTPFCDAPVRHADHVVPFALGGPTTAANGEGLCEGCNYIKESHGWSHRPVTLADGTKIVRITTPTGHSYDTAAPPVLDTLTPLGLAGQNDVHHGRNGRPEDRADHGGSGSSHDSQDPDEPP